MQYTCNILLYCQQQNEYTHSCCCDAEPASLHSIAIAAAILIDGCPYMSTHRAIAASRCVYDIFKDNFFIMLWPLRSPPRAC